MSPSSVFHAALGRPERLKRHRLVRGGIVNSRKDTRVPERNRKDQLGRASSRPDLERRPLTERASAASGTQRRRSGRKDEVEEREVGRRNSHGAPAPLILHTVHVIRTTPCRKQPGPPNGSLNNGDGWWYWSRSHAVTEPIVTGHHYYYPPSRN